MSTSQFNPLIADLSSDSIRQFPSAATLAPALHPNSPSLGARSAPSQVLSTSGLIKVAVHPLSPSAYDSRVVLFEPSINTTTSPPHNQHHQHHQQSTCLLYTSDAADEEDSVDLGGRRFIKQKKK
eukprot:TRINITY_DN33540_c0_g2_i1.p1 TRINITY_DN33540_c0_g2~~TRINITY_DN33540_c0_g2_i1.p1  ORF type:complete len:125 (-),score=28.98 TRINITY_DN33540_c0_g2_i1:58-432(-)